MELTAPADAFERLFRDEYPRMVAVARRLLDADAAQDAAQEAFAAWYARGGEAGAEHARRWLYRATVHRSLDALRAGRRRGERERRAARGLSLVSDGPQTLLEREEERASVVAVLRALRPRYAAVLALRYGGLSHREIAETLGLKVNAVGMLLVRAEAAFKKEFDRVPSR